MSELRTPGVNLCLGPASETPRGVPAASGVVRLPHGCFLCPGLQLGRSPRQGALQLREQAGHGVGEGAARATLRAQGAGQDRVGL